MKKTPRYLLRVYALIGEAERLEALAENKRRYAVAELARGLKRRVSEFDPKDVNFCPCGRYAERLDDGGDVWLCEKCIKKMRKGEGR